MVTPEDRRSSGHTATANRPPVSTNRRLMGLCPATAHAARARREGGGRKGTRAGSKPVQPFAVAVVPLPVPLRPLPPLCVTTEHRRRRAL